MADEIKADAQANTNASGAAPTPEGAAVVKEVKADVPPVTPAAQDPKPDPAKAEPEKPAVPEKYELKLPEGSALKEADIARISLESKEAGLSNEEAQAQLEWESEIITRNRSEQAKAVKQEMDSWGEAIKNDKEIGGKEFDANMVLANKVRDKYAPPELKDILSKTPWGSHPGLVKMLVRIGKDVLKDDVFERSGHSGKSKSHELGDGLYGHLTT